MITTTQKTTDRVGNNEMRALQSTSLTSGAVPKRVLLAPWGDVESTHGSFVVDDESATLVVEAFEVHGTDLPIDFEHQTLGGIYSSPTGQAPAAGWIKRIEAQPGVGLVADIEWTEHAERMLSAKEYRYLSPVALIRKTDRRLIGIHSAALTNKPAIKGIQAIVNRDDHPGSDSIPPSIPPWQRGKSEGVNDVDVTPMALLRGELGLQTNADVEEILLAASQRIAALREDAKRRYVETRIEEAMRAGKLVEVQQAWAEALVAREEGLFDEWFRTAPIVVRPGRLHPPDGVTAGAARERNAAVRAKAEYRANPLLSRLTSEEAYVAMTTREIDN